MRVLVVDDEPRIRRILARFLGSRGCTVHEAADGNEGLARLLASDYDVVLSDLTMPGLGGWDMWTHACRTRPELADGCVFVSASPLPDVPEAARARYVAKPFELDDLWNEIRVVTRRDDDRGSARNR